VPQGVLRLGTRGSALARAQSGLVARALEARHPGLRVELVFISTSGDRMQRGPVAAPAGLKGLFVKEIEESLVGGDVEVGVHSMKDMPALLARGLVLGSVPTRADARDVLVGGGPGGIRALRAGSRVGTSSVRRRAQILSLRRDLDVVPLRGNVDTRLGRLERGELDAIVLAAAGLARLGVTPPSMQPLPADELLPAVGQGMLALECRADDARTRELLAGISDPIAEAAAAAERGFLAAIGGDCNTPLAAHASVDGGRLTLRALVIDPEGRERVEDARGGPVADAARLGREAAEGLLAAGAGRLLGR
jgi:hydroxymethylbilane synthase